MPIDLMYVDSETPILAEVLDEWPALRDRLIAELAGPETTVLRVVA